ncbi:carbamoyl-phosphate synthase (glutamine-hydrolysing) [Synchytrium microbalum]|uniref:Carbamoyl phosphate synthase arginine-specific small chain n=1 Tax=Synchytrium microbalum TaxID=1806994 RepID=A0A507CFI9_9FUNG|nr:carbamoyl-phosphate synthase (glutamine-hydrolysing) [Synchytrium microbalum]TPX36694.1 carbamoyl-phosphate synthase (glutamine-hydrolysing) [Synchytrium microbalum]
MTPLARFAMMARASSLSKPSLVQTNLMQSSYIIKSSSFATLTPDNLSALTPPSATTKEEPPMLPATLTFKSGQIFHGTSFGSPLTRPITGEVVFTTSLVGYPESMTDPSYRGQILCFTQPLIGNYGVPGSVKDQFGLLKYFESEGIQVKGILVNDYATKYSHWNAVESLGKWCSRYGIPAITGVDTRAIVHILRDNGSTLGEIRIGKNEGAASTGITVPVWEDPNVRNLSAEVSVKDKVVFNAGGDVKIALIDCGVKQNIIRCLAKRGAEVTVVPWDYDITSEPAYTYDGVFISNGPGDPRTLTKTVANLQKLFTTYSSTKNPIPIFGICMGNLMMGLAAGFPVYKLPFGNRGHNQPATDLFTGKCIITSQNHGYAINVEQPSSLSAGWKPFFMNANDGSNEGLRHEVYPWQSVQFHPEAKGGPLDSEYLFEGYLNEVRAGKLARKPALVAELEKKGVSSSGRAVKV